MNNKKIMESLMSKNMNQRVEMRVHMNMIRLIDQQNKAKIRIKMPLLIIRP